MDNCGVCIRGEGGIDYYGFLEEVVELHYSGCGGKVVLFNCTWFDPINGVKVDKNHGLVEVNHRSRLRNYDPYCLACQAIQVYYLPYASPDRSDWWVPYKTRRKPNFSHEGETEDLNIFQEEMQSCDYVVSAGDELDVPSVLVRQGVLDPVDPEDLTVAPRRSRSNTESDVGDNGSESEDDVPN